MPLILLAAPLSEIVLAVALLLILWASAVILINPLAAVLSQVPVVGQDIANALSDGYQAAVTTVTEWVDFGVDALTGLIQGSIGIFRQFVDALMLTIGAGIAATFNAGQGLLGGANELAAQVSTLAAQLVAAAATILGLAAALAGVQSTVGFITNTQVPAAEGAAIDISKAFAAEQAAEARAAGIAAAEGVGAYAQGAIEAERARAIAAEAALAKATGAGALVPPFPWADELAGLEQKVADEVGAIGDTLSDVIAKVGPLTATATAAAILTVATEWPTYKRNCIDPMCTSIGPLLGLLDGLLTAAEIAAVVEFVSGAIHDPQGAAATMAAEAGAYRGLANDLAGSLFGIAA